MWCYHIYRSTYCKRDISDCSLFVKNKTMGYFEDWIALSKYAEQKRYESLPWYKKFWEKVRGPLFFFLLLAVILGTLVGGGIFIGMNIKH